MSSKTLGASGAWLLSTLAERSQSVFSVAGALQNLECSYDAALQTLRQPDGASWVVRLTAGRHAIVPRGLMPFVVSFLPASVGESKASSRFSRLRLL